MVADDAKQCSAIAALYMYHTDTARHGRDQRSRSSGTRSCRTRSSVSMFVEKRPLGALSVTPQLPRGNRLHYAQYVSRSIFGVVRADFAGSCAIMPSRDRAPKYGRSRRLLLFTDSIPTSIKTRFFAIIAAGTRSGKCKIATTRPYAAFARLQPYIAYH